MKTYISTHSSIKFQLQHWKQLYYIPTLNLISFVLQQPLQVHTLPSISTSINSPQLFLQIQNSQTTLLNQMDGSIEDVIPTNGGVTRTPPWRNHITMRGLVASLVIGMMYSVIVMKLNLTTGLVPNLNVSAALLAFVFIRTWCKLLNKAGVVTTPFTRQENTIIQTCAVACYSIAVGGTVFMVRFKIVKVKNLLNWWAWLLVWFDGRVFL